MNDYAAIMDSTERIMYSLRALYFSYGYRRYRMDKFEDYDLYGKNRDFLVSDRLITFTDGSGRLKALKPDVTLSVLRNSHGLSDGIEKYCYNESVYRMGPDGSFHEIPQSGIECIGSVDEACVAEVLLLAAKSLAVLSAEYVLSLSELTVLFALISAAAADEKDRALLFKAAAKRSLGEIDEIALSSGKKAQAAALKTLLTRPIRRRPWSSCCRCPSRGRNARRRSGSPVSSSGFVKRGFALNRILRSSGTRAITTASSSRAF